MADTKLDQVVKGAPSSDARLHLPPRPQSHRSSTSESLETASVGTNDPLSTLPSSPPQIYLNLLILEASLRSQYLTLRARRRQHTFFLLLLTGWIAFFFYALFMRPREDGRGLGGSVYWVVEMAEKVALMGGVVTAMLVWGTGQWERGIRWPRRWVGIANRGLRNVNSKLVVVKGPWYKEALSAMAFLFPYSSLFPSSESSYHYVEHVSEAPTAQVKRERPPSQRHREGSEEVVTIEEDLSPGGDYVKLLLLPKPFSPDFRENWELYRTEYWEKENERREELRKRVRAHQRELAKRRGGFFWWTGWQDWKRPSSSSGAGRDMEKSNHHHHHHHSSHAHQPSQSHPGHGQHLERSSKTRSNESLRSGSHSRTSSRSSTPTVEWDERDWRDSVSSERGSTRAKARKKGSVRSLRDVAYPS